MNNSIELTQIGRYDTGIFDEGAAEITAYDSAGQSLYVINGATKTIDILDVSDPTQPNFTQAIAIDEFGDGINSIAISNGIVAAAIEGESAQDLGSVVFFDSEGNALNQITVGALPDAVAFTPDGTKLLVANEGEPDEDDPSINPAGSISIIDLATGVESATVTTADFTAFNGQEAELRERGVRIFPGETLANDVEPEFITVSPDGTQGYVTLQENNAIAVVDLEAGEISEIQPLGLKDYSLPGNGLDPSDEDGINIRNAPVFGLYQPDAIAAYEADGQTYYVTANEGDARSEDERVAELELDPTAFPNAEELQLETELGRLEVSTIDGDTDGDGDYDRLVSYGGRSFSIFDSHGNQVFDSGDDFAQITAEQVPELFNSNGTLDSFDSRSDAKGAEPEGVVVGEVDGSTYAFVGLERVGGVIVYDISSPGESEFVQYINPIDPDTGDALDLAPEGLQFISAEDSPNGEPLLTVSNEVSGTVSIYQIEKDTILLPEDLNGDEGTPEDTDSDTKSRFEVVFGTPEADEIELTGTQQILFATEGDDLIDATATDSNNRISGGLGNDTIILGDGDRLNGDEGDDRLFVNSGGNNTLTGGIGADQFWIASVGIPESINTITDFAAGEDVIGIAGLGISFADLSLTQQDDNTLIATGENDLATLIGIDAASLTADNFAFD